MFSEDACSFFFKYYMSVSMHKAFVEMFLADLTSCGLNLQFKMKVIIVYQQQIIENNSLIMIMQAD